MKLITLRLLVDEESTRGEGVKDDPIRRILTAQTLEGQIVFEYDIHEDKVSMTGHMIEVLRNAPRELLSPTH